MVVTEEAECGWTKQGVRDFVIFYISRKVTFKPFCSSSPKLSSQANQNAQALRTSTTIRLFGDRSLESHEVGRSSTKANLYVISLLKYLLSPISLSANWRLLRCDLVCVAQRSTVRRLRFAGFFLCHLFFLRSLATRDLQVRDEANPEHGDDDAVRNTLAIRDILATEIQSQASIDHAKSDHYEAAMKIRIWLNVARSTSHRYACPVPTNVGRFFFL